MRHRSHAPHLRLPRRIYRGDVPEPEVDAATPADAPEPPVAAAHTPHRTRHIVAWTAVGVVLVVLTAGAVWLRSVPPPQPDAFYDPPSPLPDRPAGTVIRTEPLGQPVPGGGTGTKILYLTTDPTGARRASSAVVFVPPGPAPEGGRDVVAWSHPTTGIEPNCAPSLRSDVGATVPGLGGMLAAGTVVVATDYPGLGTPSPHWYLVGDAEARAVLDSVRAVRDLPTVDTTDRFVVWGHSQGGQSALFTGQVAPSYAPELELLGVVATAPAAELTRILERDLPTITGRVLGPEALVAWSEVYPGTELSSLVTGAAEDDVRAIAEGCIETTSQLAVLLPRVLLLGKDWLTFEQVDTEPWRRHIEENTPGAARIDVPILMTQGLDDTVVWADLNVDWARSACDRGESVEVITLPGVGHDGAGQASAPDVVPWITDRFAGDPAADGCDDLPDVPAPSGTPEADAEQRDPDNDLSTEE